VMNVHECLKNTMRNTSRKHPRDADSWRNLRPMMMSWELELGVGYRSEVGTRSVCKLRGKPQSVQR
jgi:hypothetical protein